MIFCVLAYCRGVNLRDVNGLILVLNVCMNGYFYALIGQALKGNNGRSGKYGCIKEKDNLNAAFRFFCHKGNLGGNRIAINQDWLAGFLIH